MAQKMVRSVVQRLESLQRAGVTHVKKPAKRASPPLAKGDSSSKPADRVPLLARPAVPSVVNGPTLLDKPAVAPVGKNATPADPRCAALAAIANDVAACTRCAELARTRTQTVFGVGNPYSRLVFCGEAPGADEDRLGEPFVGRAGQLLTDIIVKGMKMRREDVYILNILRCRPPGNRTPLPLEAANCREYLDKQLAIIQPEFICCLGAVAAQNLLGTEETIGRLRGRVHDFNGIKVVCTYHPAYVLRNPAAKRPVWDDVQMLMAEMNQRAEGGGRRAEDTP
jgi:uracil-DNA glycosylase